MAPALKKLYDKFHADGFEIVGINFDDETNLAQRFIQKQSLPWPQFFGGRDNQYGKDYALNLLPAAWLTDRKGIVCDIHGTVDLEAKIEKLMAK
jgi:peroxiredoxin